jgi:hypothetical protein
MIFALGHKRSQSPATALLVQRLLNPPPPPPGCPQAARGADAEAWLRLTIHRRREERERGARTQGHRLVCGGPEARARGDWQEAEGEAADAVAPSASPSLSAPAVACAEVAEDVAPAL